MSKMEQIELFLADKNIPDDEGGAGYDLVCS